VSSGDGGTAITLGDAVCSEGSGTGNVQPASTAANATAPANRGRCFFSTTPGPFSRFPIARLYRFSTVSALFSRFFTQIRYRGAMSNESARTWPRWVMRVTVVPVALFSLVVLFVTWFSWAFAPQAGWAAIDQSFEREELNAKMHAASQHASALAESIVIVAAVVVVVATAALMIWPKRFGFLMVAAIAPLTVVVIWMATRADLATIADPVSAMF